MQDPTTPRQQPMLFLVPLAGGEQSVEELEEAALGELREVAERHLSRLAGSASPWLGLLAAVARSAAPSSDEHRLQLLPRG